MMDEDSRYNPYEEVTGCLSGCVAGLYALGVIVYFGFEAATGDIEWDQAAFNTFFYGIFLPALVSVVVWMAEQKE